MNNEGRFKNYHKTKRKTQIRKSCKLNERTIKPDQGIKMTENMGKLNKKNRTIKRVASTKKINRKQLKIVNWKRHMIYVFCLFVCRLIKFSKIEKSIETAYFAYKKNVI